MGKRMACTLVLLTVFTALSGGPGGVLSVQGEEPVRERASAGSVPPTISDERPTVDATSNPPPVQEKSYIPPLTAREIVLSILVLVFGLIILLLQAVLLRKKPDRIDPEGILVLHAVTLIVIGTLFLICSGLSERQIAPAMGLFGTIIGYILGKRSGQRSRSGEIGQKHQGGTLS